MTVKGNFYKTDTLSEAGTNAYFDPNSGGGEMLVHLDDGKVDDDFVLAVRSMDYDWGKKDDLLGEILVYVARDLLENPGVQKSFPLRKKGKIHKGEITLSAEVQELRGKYFLRLNCHQTTGLPSADWFSKNDVYVQCYRVPSSTDVDAALPKPDKNFLIPAGEKIEMPFSMKIPLKYMPSSFSTWHGDSCYVAYSLYSNIDIKWNKDPSVRRYITVLSSELPSPSLLAPMSRIDTEPQVIYGCDCCCFTCCENGTAFFKAAVDKTYLTPGDTVFITAFAQNDTEDTCAFTVTLRQEALMQSKTGTWRFHIEHKLLEDIVPGNGTLEWWAADPKMAVIPSVPPSFQKGRATDLNGSWNSRDPLSWFYVISIKMDMPGFFATDIEWNVPVAVGAFCVNSLKEMDPVKYGGMVEPAVTAGIGEDDSPPPFDDVDYPPPTFETNDLVGSAVPVNDPKLKVPEGHRLEDKHNYGGPSQAYAPSYPVTSNKSSPSANLPDCHIKVLY